MTFLRARLWPVLLLFLLASKGLHADEACAPRIVATLTAPAGDDATRRPASGWTAVKLPDWSGTTRLDSVWYRIDWQRDCVSETGPVALGIDGISTAGEVYSNDDLLWRDASLVEPLSRSWNTPRWWLLPESGLHAGVNSVWVRAVGPRQISLGIGALRIGDMESVSAEYRHSLWRQRTVYFINAVLCAMAGALFLLVWLFRRKETAYLWFALMALSWLVYLNTYLGQSSWPWPDALTRSRSSLVALIGYVLCACLFTFRYGSQRWRWLERMLWLLAGAGVVAVLIVPDQRAGDTFSLVWKWAMNVFLLNCLQFQFHAWWPRRGGRRVHLKLLALCWLVYLVIALNSSVSLFGSWQVARDWAAFSGPLVIALVMLLLGAQLVQQMRSVESFNRELEERVARARAGLEDALVREHAEGLARVKLVERLQIAHDLHDGLGSSLVRSMALVEQARQPIPNDRVLSLLKMLRDDLRQVIDHGSSAGAIVPETPVQWLAPLRHRFTRLFDELGTACEWRIPAHWRDRPNALQCLGLTRLVEEALSNVIKHSQARRVCIRCDLPEPDRLVLSIEDDGIGFDVAAVQGAGQSVGMRSMTARAERVGGRFSVESGEAGTVVRVQLTPGSAPPGAGERAGIVDQHAFQACEPMRNALQ